MPAIFKAATLHKDSPEVKNRGVVPRCDVVKPHENSGCTGEKSKTDPAFRVGTLEAPAAGFH